MHSMRRRNEKKLRPGLDRPRPRWYQPATPDGLGGHRAVADAIGRIAQLVEQLTLNQRVLGSNPSAPTKNFRDLEAKSNDLRDLSEPSGNATGNPEAGWLLSKMPHPNLYFEATRI